MSIACGAIAPSELRVDLTQLDRSGYFDGDTAEIEATIENVGKIPVQIPLSPHLADLQPVDENERFVVRELQVGLFLNWREGYSTSLGWLNLYGDSLHSGTLVTLSPGERLRIRGQITILTRRDDGMTLPPVYLAQRASAKTLFREVEYIPHPGGLSQRISNENPKEVAGTDQPIHVFALPSNN